MQSEFIEFVNSCKLSASWSQSSIVWPAWIPTHVKSNLINAYAEPRYLASEFAGEDIKESYFNSGEKDYVGMYLPTGTNTGWLVTEQGKVIAVSKEG